MNRTNYAVFFKCGNFAGKGRLVSREFFGREGARGGKARFSVAQPFTAGKEDRNRSLIVPRGLSRDVGQGLPQYR